MKKWFLASILICILLITVSSCSSSIKQEESTRTITEIANETTSETQTIKSDLTDIYIDQESENDIEHKFDFKIEDCKKTEYEKNYSSEVLYEIYELIPMYFGLTFGCDNYNNWNGTPNVILNDIYHSMGCWMIDCYDYESDEVKRAKEELNANPYGYENCEGFYTSIEKINTFLRDVYGPEARVFKAKDFDTYDEIKTSEESVFANYDYSFRFVYLPESDVVRCLARETWGGETEGICVCDVRMLNGDYIVEAISETYYSFCVKYIMTMSCEPNGNIYVKSVDDFYILPDGCENNLRVISEDVKVEYRKYNSGDWMIIDTLSVGDEVYSTDGIYEDEDYVWIVTEEYRGRIEKKYVTEIK